MVQLSELIVGKKMLSLLLYLVNHPQQKHSYTQLRKQTKLAKATISKFLAHLRNNQCITLTAIGKNKLYQINKDNSILKQLKIMDNLCKLNFLIHASKKYNCEFYLFGSAARGEDNENSDIDILILGNVKKDEIISPIIKQAAKLKKEIKLQIFTLAQWSMAKEKDPAFYERVEKDKIHIT